MPTEQELTALANEYEGAEDANDWNAVELARGYLTLKAQRDALQAQVEQLQAALDDAEVDVERLSHD